MGVLGDILHIVAIHQRADGVVKVQALALRNAEKGELIIVGHADALDDGDTIFQAGIQSRQHDIQLSAGIGRAAVGRIDGIIHRVTAALSHQINLRIGSSAIWFPHKSWISREIEFRLVGKFNTIICTIVADDAAGDVQLAAIHFNCRVATIATSNRSADNIDSGAGIFHNCRITATVNCDIFNGDCAALHIYCISGFNSAATNTVTNGQATCGIYLKRNFTVFSDRMPAQADCHICFNMYLVS